MLERFATKKPVIGMVHLPATPGTPRFDTSRSIDEVLDGVGTISLNRMCRTRSRPR